MRILLALLLPAAAAAAATAADVGTDNASCRPPVVISRRSTDEHVQCTPLFVIVLMVSILATSAIKKNLTKCLSRVVSDAHFRRRLQLPLSQGSRLILRFAVNFIQRNRQTLKQRNPPPHALPAILPWPLEHTVTSKWSYSFNVLVISCRKTYRVQTDRQTNWRIYATHHVAGVNLSLLKFRCWLRLRFDFNSTAIPLQPYDDLRRSRPGRGRCSPS